MYALIYESNGRAKVLAVGAGDTPEEAHAVREIFRPVPAFTTIQIVEERRIGIKRVGDFVEGLGPEDYVMPRDEGGSKAPPGPGP